MSSPSTLAQVVRALERRYPPASAEAWDAVGLVCGDPAARVRRVLWAVDPVEAVVDEAIAGQADLLVTHHPLFLGGTESVAATTAKGRVVHRLISSGVALFCAHTNADVADPGVSDALAAALGLQGVRGLAELPPDPSATAAVGLGRIGDLAEPLSLPAFAEFVALSLPATWHGVRVAGDAAATVRRVAVCGGSGDSLLDVATAAGADAYVTADLKHHRASEHLANGGCAIVDVAHWASEWPWLAQAAALLVEDLAREGATVECIVSAAPTDPWSAHVRSPR